MFSSSLSNPSTTLHYTTLHHISHHISLCRHSSPVLSCPVLCLGVMCCKDSSSSFVQLLFLPWRHVMPHPVLILSCPVLPCPVLLDMASSYLVINASCFFSLMSSFVGSNELVFELSLQCLIRDKRKNDDVMNALIVY